MPRLLFARLPQDVSEERTLRKLSTSRHAPSDWIQRAQMIVRSWAGERTTVIARELGVHPQTVRERLQRFNAEGIEGLADRRGAGRKPRLTEGERSALIALVASPPSGRLLRQADGTLESTTPQAGAQWTLDSLVSAAQLKGIQVGRSQLRRILLAEGVRWRRPRSWATSTDPDFVPKGRRSSPSTPTHPRMAR